MPLCAPHTHRTHIHTLAHPHTFTHSHTHAQYTRIHSSTHDTPTVQRKRTHRRVPPVHIAVGATTDDVRAVAAERQGVDEVHVLVEDVKAHAAPSVPQPHTEVVRGPATTRQPAGTTTAMGEKRSTVARDNKTRTSEREKGGTGEREKGRKGEREKGRKGEREEGRKGEKEKRRKGWWALQAGVWRQLAKHGNTHDASSVGV